MNHGLVEREGFAALVLRLRGDGLQDKTLLSAAEQTPRTAFVPHPHIASAYSRRLVPIECGAFMEGADLALQMIYLLMVKAGQRVLEIGTGSGFTAAVLARIAERVVTLDRYKTLVTRAQERFDQFGLSNVAARQADGSQGLKGEGTFDRILVTAAFSSMPRWFVEQLAMNGVMVAPLLDEYGRCTLVRLTKIGARFEREDLFPVPFQPLIPGKAAAL
ncbi:MAG: protein-L-isoaspartate(D-aspartate) O-methyltransferase [Pararhizobium sp.]